MQLGCHAWVPPPGGWPPVAAAAYTDSSLPAPSMPVSRRQWLGLLPGGAAALASLADTSGWLRRSLRTRIRPLTLDPDRLKPFVDPLPIPPLAASTRPGHYRIVMQAADCQLHRDL